MESFTVGDNEYGQLAMEHRRKAQPIRWMTKDWTKISLGYYHSCGIRSGKVYCWGNVNSLFDEEVTVPFQIGEHDDWEKVESGFFSSCGIRKGELYCWGYNFYGNIGNGTEDDADSPVRVGVENDWSALSMKSMHVCGILSGEIYCWGSNAYGQIGNGITGYFEKVLSPHKVGDYKDWTDVRTGTGITCGMRMGELYCWGLNGLGQFGDGTVQSKTTPFPTGTGNEWSEIVLGTWHSCGKKGAEVYCWGGYSYGQTGTGKISIRTEPELIYENGEISSVFGSNAYLYDRFRKLFCWGSIS